MGRGRIAGGRGVQSTAIVVTGMAVLPCCNPESRTHHSAKTEGTVGAGPGLPGIAGREGGAGAGA